jgi:peptidoglycan/xylan/chitin deacetylase (PgdA/CDA1 family)
VGILLYHNPEPEVLEQHLRYLGERYRFIALDDVVDALRSGDWDRIPPRSLVVTLDDGHRGNVSLVPLFERAGIRPTLYVCTQIVGTRRRFWWMELDTKTRERLFAVPNVERLRVLAEEHGFDQEAESANGDRQALDADDLAAVLTSVDLQAHTRFHPVLTSCSDEEAEREIAGSRIEVEQLSGRSCRHFSYPNGYYTDREIELARAAGYASARTIETGWTDATSDPYRLKILGISDDASVNLLAAQLSGLPYVRDLMYR